ncbi:hypothetical protein JW935_22245 [candidate division KSB1 bacterium]|nr:hypothetical protein [candidate division KSB1 bacterium]
MAKRLLLLFFTVALLSPAATAAPLAGIRAGLYTDVDEFFIGGDLVFKLAPRLDFNPNLEYVFVEDVSYMTINFDVLYYIYSSRKSYGWVGGGLAMTRLKADGADKGDSDTGLNLLFGIGFKNRGSIPYLQAKLIMGDYDDFVIGGGFRFRL